MSADAQGIIRRILTQRSIKDVDRFLYPDYERDGHDPWFLPDIKPALRRLLKAKNDKEKVVIYGDYDIDGLCASALLSDALGRMGFLVEVFIPDRFKEGYGLNASALKKIAEDGAKLVVTVDCGSNSTDEIKQAAKFGLDIIVTDHHEPSWSDETKPPAVAIVNPKRSDSKYPWRELAGNGVAFKLVQALQSETDGLPPGQEKWLLDLVAFGTVCDVVPLLDENRMLVRKGLEVMAVSRRPGFQALSQVTGVGLDRVNASTLGFIFGPRLNAAGRLVHAKKALELLACEDYDEALALAAELDELNARRKREQTDIEKEALAQAEQFDQDPVLVLAGEDWSHGIIGIVAARLLERHGKPVFIMQQLGDKAKGSARSFGDFSAVDGLESVRKLLLTGGGHSAAAGFSIKAKDIAAMREQLNRYYHSLELDDQSHHLRSNPDVSITTLAALNLDLWQKLQLLQPFGHGNPEPRLQLESMQVVDWRRVGADKTHLKVIVRDGRGLELDGIAFRFESNPPDGPVNIIARLDRNEYNGRVSPQLVISEISPTK